MFIPEWLIALIVLRVLYVIIFPKVYIRHESPAEAFKRKQERDMYL